MEFSVLKNAVAKQFERMGKVELYRTNVEKDDLWDTYIASFPAGSNPIYKERTEHDCTCCKQFIRAVGNVVAIIDGKIESIWDINIDEPNYQTVANALSALVKSKAINDTFLHYEKTAGTSKNFENTVGGVHTWEHFFVNIPTKFVMKNADIATALSVIRSTHDVFLRGLNEITVDAIDTVQELISQNTLYRGAEQKFVIESFSKLKTKFDKLKVEDRDNFVWSNMSTTGSVTNIRNSVIGTLLTDLSEGKDLEAAVGSYEAKVAPTNYKRPTALVTPSMIKDAQKKIVELGLTSALERRYATIDDITINNVLYANRTARKVIDNVFDELITKTTNKKPKSLDKVDEVTIDKFIADILPKAESIEIMLDNTHTGNLVSLIAPVDPTAKNLFKWDNKFSWSYNGELADSIKERVKQAGGNVTGDLCCRLAWFNHDDLDFHMTEPDGNKISFRDKSSYYTGGQLDVDMQAGGGTTRTPVENIFYGNKSKMKEGVYKLEVNQWASRESKDIGFEVEIDFMGTVHRFVYDKKMGSGSTTLVAQFKYSHKDGIEFIKALPSTQSVKDVWGVPTQTFHKVSVMMMSPNFWDDMKVGNKHYFFMLENCLNEGKARGFFNEFLVEELNVHRKVIEVVGSKMSTKESDKQLSGVGFSSTQRNSVLCKVIGSFSRIVKVVF